MSSNNHAYRKSNVQDKRIVKASRRVIVAWKFLRKKHDFLCDAAAIAVDFRKLNFLSNKKYGARLVSTHVFAAFRRSFRLNNRSNLASTLIR